MYEPKVTLANLSVIIPTAPQFAPVRVMRIFERILNPDEKKLPDDFFWLGTKPLLTLCTQNFDFIFFGKPKFNFGTFAFYKKFKPLFRGWVTKNSVKKFTLVGHGLNVFLITRASVRGKFISVNFRLCDGSGVAVRKDRLVRLGEWQRRFGRTKQSRHQVFLPDGIFAVWLEVLVPTYST